MSTKSKLLLLLEQNRGQSVSGHDIAQRLGISRSAVWKAAESLRQDGHGIDALPNRGYRLCASSDRLSPEAIRLHLVPAYSACPVTVLPSIDSTNTQAKRMALEGVPHGTLLLAEEQTAGRGRFGRAFFSPEGAGLYMSLILRPKASLADTRFLTIAAAVAACRAIEDLTALHPRIKWVNDLFLDGKKVGGILTEAVGNLESGQMESVVLGIGINCSGEQETFPAALHPIAGALNAPELSRSRLAAHIASGILTYLDAPCRSTMLAEYKRRSLMQGREICYELAGKSHTATVLDIDENGSLVVQAADGGTSVLSSGEVTLRSSRFSANG